MQNKRTVAKIAAVALMLSAFASPLAANAATGPLANYYATALTDAGEGWSPSAADKNAKPVAVFMNQADPVELAKQYAPDTVEAWEQTLAQFKALAKDAVKVVAGSATTVTKPGPDGKPLTITISKAADGELKVVGPISPDQLKTIKLKDGAAVAVKAAPAVPAEGATLVPAGKLNAVKAEAGQAVTFEGGAKVTVALKDAATLPAGAKIASLQAVAIDNPLVKGQLALSKAAESKDAEAIKEALANLLGLYQDEIAKLQQQQEQADK
ncbi:hypothetical protein SAMN02799624_05721 [Paenibacillus sp. UNC496MF]|uniref:hypothetical protein n=1 Tax=Paenibacillus sp. UNC496MF TaxID=1502753 RepID=UPI0008E71A04|nr:hypothetical protein [Paenibacillus sp. UNC496MF]SFJ73360.1 hypothetical protein SAMN02799624_05721 [Paenibacillus sp. UNC496MF]